MDETCKRNRIIFHIDVNSAFLSWEAIARLDAGEKTDLREIPSAVGGDIETRHGVILAKSDCCSMMLPHCILSQARRTYCVSLGFQRMVSLAGVSIFL